MRLTTTFDLHGWYDHIRSAGRPIVWCSAFAPAEALIAAGLMPVYPENHAAMLGSLAPERGGIQYSAGAIAAAKSAGYSGPRLCSYALADLGVLAGGAPSPLGRLPDPDAFYACDSQCAVVARWGAAVVACFPDRDLPNFVLRAPAPGVAGHTRAQLADFRTQLDGHLTAIFKRFGDPGFAQRLPLVLAEAAEANRLWQACLEVGRTQPAPWTVWDAFTAMAPIVVARGYPEATAYYRALLGELQARVAAGYAAVPGERVRFVWDAIPIWPRRGWLARFSADHQAAAVVSTYTHSWWFELDPAAGLDGLCARYAWNTMNLPARQVLDWTVRLAKDFHADRVVCHMNRSCGIWNSYVKRRIDGLRAAGLRVLILEADMVDPAAFDEARISADLAAFLA